MSQPPVSRVLLRWHDRLSELEALAQPLLDAPAFRRLGKITFLGILSPHFQALVGSPLSEDSASARPDDGSRLEHTIGVTLTALDLARHLGLSPRGQLYAVAWGLTHDIATWPLSHTSEPAFRVLTKMSSRQVRLEMVLGSDLVPARYRINEVLRAMGVEPPTLGALFARLPLPADEELLLLREVVASPLTPDTLEGTWRCGTVYGVPVPAPAEVLPAFTRRGGTACLDRGYLSVVREFWSRKAEVYRRYINREDVVLWESAWSEAIQREFVGLGLAETLEIPEEVLMNRVLAAGLPAFSRVVRYKEPQRYYVHGSLDALPAESPVSELWEVLPGTSRNFSVMSEHIKQYVNPRAWEVLEKARQHCDRVLTEVRAVVDAFLANQGVDPAGVCCVVVGSVGRQEALEASDIDLIPLLSSTATLAAFQPHDKPLRQAIREKLNTKVSKGEDLTKCVSVDELTDPESIGGEKDGSSPLTKRILILTEGKQAGGKFPLNDVRRGVMKAYAGADRSRGRHVLSLCNDIARYYRTLCIEYKAKVDAPEEDWCSRNVKLRHSRKFWYFACLMTIVALADSNPHGDDTYIEGLLKAFDESPVQRLFNSVRQDHLGLAGRVTEPFTWFLEFMAVQANRQKLAETAHGNRYAVTLGNPFPAVKFNSDRLHQEMLSLIESLPAHQRHRILSWFLL